MPNALCRVVALCLLLLAVSPFTAPFSTFDFDHFTFGTGAGDVSAKVKDSHKDIVGALPAMESAPVVDDRAWRRWWHAEDVRTRSTRLHTVLRI